MYKWGEARSPKTNRPIYKKCEICSEYDLSSDIKKTKIYEIEKIVNCESKYKLHVCFECYLRIKKFIHIESES